MPGIMEFAAEMKKGFARPNLFQVQVFTNPDMKTKSEAVRHFQHSCFQAQIPGSNILTTDKDLGFRSVAYQKAFSDVILGFYVSADLRELKFWQDWIYEIVNYKTPRLEYYSKYTGAVEVGQIDREGKGVAKWKLYEAYPKQVDPIQLDYGTNDAVMTCNVTITYRHFEVDWTGWEYDSEGKYKDGGRTIPNDTVKTTMMSGINNKDKSQHSAHIGGATTNINDIRTRNGFLAANPGFFQMSKEQQIATARHFGLSIREGGSPTGGAGSMTIDPAELAKKHEGR